MKKKGKMFGAVAAALICAAVALPSCGSGDKNASAKAEVERKDAGGAPGGLRLGTPGGGPVIDKTSDSVLQDMIKSLVPRFEQLEYADSITGKTLKYNLFTPKNAAGGQKLPLVLFMADASTPGADFVLPLTQGYGALVWATDEWQKAHPCYILVPQFSGVAVNDAYEHTEEVDAVIRLMNGIVADRGIDWQRLYTTGQSMGGMISMYYNIRYPSVFAASLFVDCHWDMAFADELVHHKFTFVTAGDAGKSFADIRAIEKAAESEAIKYEYAQWSAKLPQSEQDALASAMLGKGAPVNIINFTPKSVLPADGKGREHMYSFDYAYKLTPVMEWLFNQSR